MRLVYVLLSSTFGMHQYTADLANRMAAAGHAVHLVTTVHCPRDRYAPEVILHTPLSTRSTGFSPQGLRVWAIRPLLASIRCLQPDLVHFTGPHLWNPALLLLLRRAAIPTIHSLHDLHPHAGAVYGRLLYAWNDLVLRLADRILVHGHVYRDELLARGFPPDHLSCTPLLHLFLSHRSESAWRATSLPTPYFLLPTSSSLLPTPSPYVLFFARLEIYKGISVLVEAMRRLEADPGPPVRAILAGPGNLERLAAGPLPGNLEVRNHLIEDDEALTLFSQCELVVLPYIEASQSALVAAAYSFGKPVIVTRVGALPEYVLEGQTGWVVSPGDAAALAACLQRAFGDRSRLTRMGDNGQLWYNQQRNQEFETLLEMYEHTIP